MEKLNIIPYPNYVKFLGGSIPVADLDMRSSTISISEDISSPEGYELLITGGRVKIAAGGKAGAFYAKQTLRQLAAESRGALPCVDIRDEPVYSYRGFMLDSARHMTAIDDVKKLIDAAAMLKLNVMHWHLTDDQGWRIEIGSCPALNEIGSRRAGSNFGRVHSAKEYAGYYTKRELRDIVDYCAKRYIEVIPEIDMPGHMIAAIAAYPDISCRGEKIPVETRQGIFPDILCAGSEKTYEIIFDVLTEVMDIFPSPTIHIGGDEAPKRRWEECPRCQKLAAELGLNEKEELQGWFMNRIAEFLRSNGRRAITWNESLNSGLLAEDITVQMWMDRKKRSVSFANRGGKIIVSPFHQYYTDYPYGMTPLNKTYRFEPLLKGLTQEGARNVIGVEAPVWTEHIRDFKHLCYMVYPRFAAVAETGWTMSQNKDTLDFNRRMAIFAPQLEAIGIKPAPAAEWNPNPLRRITETLKFFRGTITKDMIKGYD